MQGVTGGFRSFWASFATAIVADYRPCGLFVPQGFKEYTGNAGELSIDPFVEAPKGTEVVVIDSVHPLPVRHCQPTFHYVAASVSWRRLSIRAICVFHLLGAEMANSMVLLVHLHLLPVDTAGVRPLLELILRLPIPNNLATLF